MKKLFVWIIVMALVVFGSGIALAGEYHSGGTLLCTDCHTIHFSMQHNWDGTTPVPTTPAAGGNWLGASGPNQYLLKAPANQLCLSCHDQQTFAPDVFTANRNASPTQGREAGALNDLSSATPYENWKGHTLGATTQPPGFNPTLIGAPANWYIPGNTLMCINCHATHGSATAFRNLGPTALSSAQSSVQPTYVISTTNDTTKDIWINLTSYTSGSGNANTFNPYYDTANIFFNRNDATVVSLKTSNKISTLCAACHANFHGGPGDANIGGTPAALNGFIRHPSAQVTIGASVTQGYSEHSDLSRYVAKTNKVKVATTDYTNYSNATPICLSCHKSHGNQNPFGLIFMNGTGAVTEEGTGTIVSTGYRDLCGQCHSQGN